MLQLSIATSLLTCMWDPHVQKRQTDDIGNGLNRDSGYKIVLFLSLYNKKNNPKWIWYGHNSCSQTQHVQIVDSGKSRDWLSYEVAVKKNCSFILVQQWKIPRSCQVQLKYHTTTEPERRIHCRVLKRTRWWDQRCFQPWALQQAHFLRGWEEGSCAADVAACSAALRSYLCSFQFRLSLD